MTTVDDRFISIYELDIAILRRKNLLITNFVKNTVDKIHKEYEEGYFKIIITIYEEYHDEEGRRKQTLLYSFPTKEDFDGWINEEFPGII